MDTTREVIDLVGAARRRAAELLGCREAASAGEVRAAFRRQLKVARPDLGDAGAAWLESVQGARDLLLVAAGPDRRRRPRTAAAPARYLPLRRTTWTPPDDGPAVIDLRL